MSSFDCRMYYIHAVFHVHLSIFNNQDGVLGGQTNQRYQTNLHINVIVLSTQILSQKAAKYCRRYGQQNCQRNSPAFIQRSQAQENEYQRNNKDLSRTSACFNFVTALVNPFVGIGIRQNFCRNFFQRCHGLTGRIPFSRVTGNLNGAGTVITGHDDRSIFTLRLNQSIQRYHLAIVAAYEEEAHIIGAGTMGRISLHNNFPNTAKTIDIINFSTA